MARVSFDFDGALAAARRLWAFADQLDALAATRESAQAAASVGFEGPFATEFDRRVLTERADLGRAVVQLRAAATAWAEAWRDAIDQENRNRNARAYRYNQQHQGLFGWLDGVERPPEPVPVATPRPPAYAPTGGLQQFGRMVP